MGRMKKTFYIFLLVLLMISKVCLVSYAMDTGSAEEEKVTGEEATGEEVPKEEIWEKKGPWTMETLYEIAIKNSIQAPIDDINILIKEKALEQAKEDAAFLGDVYGSQRALNNRITKEVRPFEGETNLELAKKAKEDNINNLKHNVYKTVQGLLIAEKELETEIKRLDILFKRYDFLKLKKDQGQVSDNAFIDIEFGIEGKRMDIVKGEENIEKIKTDIKRLLGLSLDFNLPKIAEKMVYESISNIDIHRIIEKALKNSTTVFKYNKDIEAIEKTLELTAEYYPTSNTLYLTPKHNLEQVKMSLDEYKLETEVNIKNSYGNLLSQKDRVLLAEKHLDIMKKKLNEVKLKYDYGFSTKDAVINAEEAIINSEYQLNSVIYSYIIMKADFDKLGER